MVGDGDDDDVRAHCVCAPLVGGGGSVGVVLLFRRRSKMTPAPTKLNFSQAPTSSRHRYNEGPLVVWHTLFSLAKTRRDETSGPIHVWGSPNGRGQRATIRLNLASILFVFVVFVVVVNVK